MQRSKTRRQIGAATVDSEDILYEIVGSDAEERDIVYQCMDRERGRRGLDHHAERKLVPVLDSSRVQLGSRLVEEYAGLPDLVEGDDEGKHDADITMHRGAQQRTKLCLEQLGLVEAHPDGAPAEEWIRIRWIPANRKLVASDIEGADHHRPSSKCFDDMPVGLILLLFVRHRRPAYHEELRAHQANALGAAMSSELGLLGQIDVCAKGDPVSIESDRVGGGHPRELDHFRRFSRPPLAIGGELRRTRIDHEYTRGAIEDRVLAAIKPPGRVPQ